MAVSQNQSLWNISPLSHPSPPSPYLPCFLALLRTAGKDGIRVNHHNGMVGTGWVDGVAAVSRKRPRGYIPCPSPADPPALVQKKRSHLEKLRE